LILADFIWRIIDKIKEARVQRAHQADLMRRIEALSPSEADALMTLSLVETNPPNSTALTLEMRPSLIEKDDVRGGWRIIERHAGIIKKWAKKRSKH
jgi:hypothetical protein